MTTMKTYATDVLPHKFSIQNAISFLNKQSITEDRIKYGEQGHGVLKLNKRVGFFHPVSYSQRKYLSSEGFSLLILLILRTIPWLIHN